MTERSDRAKSEIEQVIAKYVMRLVWAIVAFAFSAGVWATKMQADITATRESVARIETKVREHEEILQNSNVAATKWRDEMAKWQVDFERRLTGEMANRMRFTSSDYDKAVWVQRQSSDKLLPYFAELKQLGKAHN